MIQINLLPQNLRKRKREIPEIPLLPVGIGIVVILIVSSFILLAVLSHYQGRVKTLSGQLKQKNLSKQKAFKLQTGVKRFRSKERIIDQLTRRKFFWAEKLNLISDLIPNGVWLTDISFKETGSSGFLTLDGMAIPYKKQEMINLVTLFMKNLKQDSIFYNEFASIKLGPIHRIKIGDVEAMQFSLTCQFKKEEKKDE
ncbi:MAG: PilN domain-containing protein [Candidatus Omnitrophota bacterium]|nr:PilN domain-containing protein [Candidatus Omnitrophota bacterium]